MTKYFPFLIAVALFGAGCAPSNTPATQTSNPTTTNGIATKSACDLFTSDIAGSELGGTPTPQKMNGETTGADTTASTCGWSANGSASTLLVRTSPTASEASKAFTDAKSQAVSIFNATPEDVTGMGDAAYWVGSPLNQLNVLKGNQWLILGLLKGTSQTDRTAITTAMQAILKKM